MMASNDNEFAMANASSSDNSETKHFEKPAFVPVTYEDVPKFNTINSDIDSFFVAFSLIGAYRIGPFIEIDVEPKKPLSVCQNIKFLDYHFGATRKNFDHVEFVVGGDSTCQLRVLISVPKLVESVTSDSSDEDIHHTSPENVLYPFRTQFMELILRPAICKLPINSVSRRKGAGSLGSSRWHIHRTDWSVLCDEVSKLTVEFGLFRDHLFYVAAHGLQIPYTEFTQFVDRYVDLHHASIVSLQVHVGMNLDLKSKVRGLMASRQNVLAVMKGVKFYPGMLNYDYGYCKSAGLQPLHTKKLPMATYVQMYNPAVHILRRGLSDVSLFTWIMLGGETTQSCNMSAFKEIDNVRIKFFNAFHSFIDNAVFGPGLRVETVISGKTSTEVLSLLPTYGSRMLEFMIDNEILVKTTKTVPYFVDQTAGDWLLLLKRCVDSLSTTTFSSSLLAQVYDYEILLRFWAFGESRWLDSDRLGSMLPVRQIVVGKKKKQRRDVDGWVPFSPQNIGKFTHLEESRIYGKVPIHRVLRTIISVVFNNINVTDLFQSSSSDAACTWVVLFATYVSINCGMGTPMGVTSALSVKRVVREYGRTLSGQYRRLSICGTVDPDDALKAFINPSCYILSTLLNIIRHRNDVGEVIDHLKGIIEEHVEVFPAIIINSTSSPHFSEWMFVGPLDPRSSQMTSLRAEMMEAQCTGDLSRRAPNY